MKHLTRRDLVSALPALSLLSTALAQTTSPGSAKNDAGTLPAHCHVFTYSDLPKSTNPSGAITHSGFYGTLPTGQYIEMHETTLAPGQSPHPPHHHIHSEFMLIREGSIEFSMGDTSQIATPGSICYARSGETHGLKNVGSTPANYFVIAIGKEPA